MAFHPYPQLIPSVFNLSGFGPPRRLTGASPWPWVDHPASGPERATTPHEVDTPSSDSLSLRLPPNGLTSRRAADSQAHSSKGTPPPPRRRALTACRRPVSGTVSLPSRGAFHPSLTVLVHYRSPGGIQACRVVPADSQRISRARCYSGTDHGRARAFGYRALTVCGGPSQATSPNTRHLSLPPPTAVDGQVNPTTPRTQPPPGITRTRFSLLRFRSPLLAESRLFSPPAGTEMFHFPAFPPAPYTFKRG